MKAKDIVVFLLIVAAGYGIGQLGLMWFKSGPETIQQVPLEKLLGAKLSLTPEQRVDYDLLLEKGEILQFSGRYKEAIEKAKELILANAWNVSGHRLFGSVGLDYYFTKRRSDEETIIIPEEDIRKAVGIAYRLAPTNQLVLELKARYYFLVAYVAKREGRVAVAKKSFELSHRFVDKSMALQGEKPNLLLIKARFFMGEEKVDEALLLLEKALTMQDAGRLAVDLHLSRASVFVFKKEDEKVEQALDAALAVKGISEYQKYTVLQNRYTFHREQNRLYAARTDLITMQKLRPDVESIPEDIKLIEDLIGKQNKKEKEGGVE